jgi:aryl-alcohol dehydrogenase-like predicted oxidoreductase
MPLLRLPVRLASLLCVLCPPLLSALSTSTFSGESGSLNRREAFDKLITASSAVGLVTTASPLWLPSKRAVAAVDSATESTASMVPTIQLGKGSLRISRTIQGYWQLAGGHGRYREEDAINNMKAHLAAGITALDTADIYGPSELLVGKFVASCTSMKIQPVPCTKFCCFRYLEEIDRAEVRQRILKSCERLQVSALPLVAFFWSNYDIKKYVEVGLWLAELKEEGLIQEIGATNFDLKRLQEMHKAGVPIVSNQVQMSALDRRPVQSGMADWCSENDVKLIAFGTVGSGILSNRYLGRGPPTQEEKNTASMRMYSSTATRFGDWKLVQSLLKTMEDIALQARSDGRCPDGTSL